VIPLQGNDGAIRPQHETKGFKCGRCFNIDMHNHALPYYKSLLGQVGGMSPSSHTGVQEMIDLMGTFSVTSYIKDRDGQEHIGISVGE
jgi:hypothetical protein